MQLDAFRLSETVTRKCQVPPCNGLQHKECTVQQCSNRWVFIRVFRHIFKLIEIWLNIRKRKHLINKALLIPSNCVCVPYLGFGLMLVFSCTRQTKAFLKLSTTSQDFHKDIININNYFKKETQTVKACQWAMEDIKTLCLLLPALSSDIPLNERGALPFVGASLSERDLIHSNHLTYFAYCVWSQKNIQHTHTHT